VRVTVPAGWVVGATGTLADVSPQLSRAIEDSLKAARSDSTGHVVRIFTPGSPPPATASPRSWHFRAPDVRDFAWGASNEYAWDATRALVKNAAGGLDTVEINSFFRLTPQAL